MDTNWIKRDDSPKSIFNPLTEEFIAEYRDDKNIPQTVRLLPMSVNTFPKWLADNIVRQLIVAVQNKRNISPGDMVKEQEIRKEIEFNENR